MRHPTDRIGVTLERSPGSHGERPPGPEPFERLSGCRPLARREPGRVRRDGGRVPWEDEGAFRAISGLHEGDSRE
ncbi:hypothetical protein [Natronorarus salvus]|uniref:hypothetical protein n=1 Tax=Natronorarus salvus TaxID=3117733 RepID=UPI002F2668B5